MTDKPALLVYRAILNKRDDGFTIGMIAHDTDLPQQNVSYHMKKLLEAGILRKENKHKGYYYIIDLDSMVSLILENKVDRRDIESPDFKKIDRDDYELQFVIDLTRHTRALRLRNWEIAQEETLAIITDMQAELKKAIDWLRLSTPERGTAIAKLKDDSFNEVDWREVIPALANSYTDSEWNELITGYGGAEQKPLKEKKPRETNSSRDSTNTSRETNSAIDDDIPKAFRGFKEPTKEWWFAVCREYDKTGKQLDFIDPRVKGFMENYPDIQARWDYEYLQSKRSR